MDITNNFLKIKRMIEETPIEGIHIILDKLHATPPIPVLGNLLDLFLLTSDWDKNMDEQYVSAIRLWKKNEEKSRRSKVQRELNRRRKSTRFAPYPKVLINLFQLKKREILPWDNKYVDPFCGYIDRIKQTDLKERIVKGVDERCSRPFIAFIDDENKLCTLFQRYQKEPDVNNPLWVAISNNSKILQGENSRISDDNFETFIENTKKYASQLFV